MTRKATVLVLVAVVVAGSFVGLAASLEPNAADGAALAQETTTAANDTVADTETAVDTETETGTETTVANETETPGPAPQPDNASLTILNQTAGITFVEQTPNDTIVMVERAVLPEGGFVVIHAAQNASAEYATEENVAVGPVLGNSTYLGPGNHSNVVIQLDRPMTESQTLVAMAHRDTNGNQQYDFPEADGPYTYLDSPVIDTAYIIATDASGQPIIANDTAANDAAANETTAFGTTTPA